LSGLKCVVDAITIMGSQLGVPVSERSIGPALFNTTGAGTISLRSTQLEAAQVSGAPTGSCVNYGSRRSAVNSEAGPSRVPFGAVPLPPGGAQSIVLYLI
jgi:hypothetical protein